MANSFERQTAYKVWLSNLYNGNFVKSDEEFKPSYVAVNNKNISRVNLIVNVVNKYEKEGGGYVSLVVDDGSAQIRVKCWGEDIKLLEGVERSDIILLVGKLKEDRTTEDGLYINAEIVKKVEPNFEILRKLELIKELGKYKEYSGKKFLIKEEVEEQEFVEEIRISSSFLRQKILNLIEKNEDMNFENIIKGCEESEEKVSDELNELIKDGDIFEVKGKYKLLR